MIHISELAGTDKEIIVEKREGMYTYEEIIYTDQDTNDFKHVAFLATDDDTLFTKIYEKK